MSKRRSDVEVRTQIDALRKRESEAPQYLKEMYQRAGEVLEWVLGLMEKEDVIAFG